MGKLPQIIELQESFTSTVLDSVELPRNLPKKYFGMVRCFARDRLAD
jgi:hypothetical protein